MPRSPAAEQKDPGLRQIRGGWAVPGPQLEVYAQSFGLPVKHARLDICARWPAISSPGAPSRVRCGHDHDLVHTESSSVTASPSLLG
jgi:hypothetical protein